MSNDNSGNNQAIRFSAQVSKVTTLADGGLRLVLDLSENDIEVAKDMMKVRKMGAVLEVAAVPVLMAEAKKESVQGWKA